MKKLTVCMVTCDNPVSTKVCMEWLRKTVDPSLTHVVLVDNGSTPPCQPYGADQIVRYEENIGGNAVIHRVLSELAPTEYIGFLHCDFVTREPCWDIRVVSIMQDCYLSMAGFVGSNEVDERGGRGGGTALSYMGATYEGIGVSSKAEQHGRRLRIGDIMPAAVLDHCSMFWKTSELMALTPTDGHYCPEHFMDRVWSCEVLERGGRIAVIGSETDHFGGGIAGGTPKADALRKKWLEAEGLPYDPQRSDLAVYVESERRFHARFLATGFIPLRVRPDWTIEHQHALKGGAWKPSPR